MSLSHRADKLVALPVQILESADAVILKRGNTEIRIASSAVAEVLRTLFAELRERGASREELLESFHEADRPAVEDLINKLVDHRLLVPENEYGCPSQCPESSLEVFYWQFGQRAATVVERINSHRIAILGVNCISQQLVRSLVSSGVVSAQVVDCHPLRNQRFYDKVGNLNGDAWPVPLEQPIHFKEWARSAESWDCLVATSDCGGQRILQDLNRMAVKHKRHFLPVTLRKWIGYVGPFVVPCDTACFQCLVARQNSNLEETKADDAMEAFEYDAQPTEGFHPAMASILGDIAAMELTKFYSGVLPGLNIGTLIEVNLLATQMTSRKVLKIPGCLVCSPSMIRPSITPYKDGFLVETND